MQSKWIGKSLTVWGGIVLILPGLAQLFGTDIGDTSGLDSAGQSIIMGISEAVGFLMVVAGRVRANNGAPVALAPKL